MRVYWIVDDFGNIDKVNDAMRRAAIDDSPRTTMAELIRETRYVEGRRDTLQRRMNELTKQFPPHRRAYGEVIATAFQPEQIAIASSAKGHVMERKVEAGWFFVIACDTGEIVHKKATECHVETTADAMAELRKEFEADNCVEARTHRLAALDKIAARLSRSVG